MFKDEETGAFTKADESPVTPADTAHLYFTADCETDVQGGYRVRYCYAQTYKNNMLLTFTDGLPAYASNFYIDIKNDSFTFRPMTIYPSWDPNEKIVSKISRQKLILDNKNYLPGDTIKGFIDAAFIEEVHTPGKPTRFFTYYFRGYFKTLLLKESNTGIYIVIKKQSLKYTINEKNGN